MPDGGDNTQTATTTKGLPSYLDTALQDVTKAGKAAALQPYQLYQGPRVAPLTGNQQQAMGFTADTLGTRGQAYQTARDTASGLTGFTPSTVSAQQIGALPNVTPSTVNAPGPISYDRVSAQMIDPSQAGQVNLRQMTGAEDIAAKLFPDLARNIDAYMNPQTQAALNPTLREMATQNDALQNQINASAAAGGAFGGSRHGIINAEQNRNYGQAVGDVTSKAYQDAYERARQSIFQDIGNTLQADMSNQQMRQRTGEQNLAAGISTDQFNASNLMKALLGNQSAGLQAAIANQGAGVQTGIAGMDAALKAAIANQGAGLTAQTAMLDAALKKGIANQGASLQADLGNQSAGIQGANLGLNAARALEDMGYRNQQMQLQTARDLFGMGNIEQALGQKNLDLAYQDFNDQNNWGWDQITKYANLLKSQPSSSTSTTVTDPGDPNLWAQILGGAGNSAGLGGKNGLNLWGSPTSLIF